MIKLLLILATALPALKVRRTADFKVTGNGNDPHWAQTEWVSLPQRAPGSGPMDTKVKLLYSQTGIYCLFHCADKKITATMNADFMDLWNEDVAEMFLWPDESSPTYFEYEISPLNHELPILVSNHKGNLVRWMPFHYDGDRRTQHAVAVQEKGWTAECFIPYQLMRPLNNIAPKPGAVWRANFYRVDYDNGPVEWSWQLTGESFHDIEKFGRLLFE